MNHTAGELAEYLRARIHGDAHAQVVGVASPEGAKPEDLIYVDSPRQTARGAGARGGPRREVLFSVDSPGQPAGAEASAARCVIVAAGTMVAGKIMLEV